MNFISNSALVSKMAIYSTLPVFFCMLTDCIYKTNNKKTGDDSNSISMLLFKMFPKLRKNTDM